MPRAAGYPDPGRNFNYDVSITGISWARAKFSKISGLKSSIEKIEYREGDEPIRMRKLPGKATFDDVTLERGIVTGADFIGALNLVYNGTNHSPGAIDHAYLIDSIVINLLDRQNTTGSPVVLATWTLINSWVMSFEVGDFDAAGNETMIEKLVLAVEEIGIVPGSVAISGS